MNARRLGGQVAAQLAPSPLATVTAFTLLCASPVSAYRTGADLPELAGTSRVRWASSQLVYAVDVRGVPGLDYDSGAASIDRAFRVWGEQTCGGFTFLGYGGAGIPRSGDGSNGLGWLQYDWASTGLSPDAAGVTDLVYQESGTGEWEIVEADISMNAHDFSWAKLGWATSSTDRIVELAVAHEGGHALGLLHNCSHDGSEPAPLCTTLPSSAEQTMFPLYRDVNDLALGNDDIQGLCFLYPGCDPGCEPGARCVDRTCVPPCGDTACTTEEICVDGVCVTNSGDPAPRLGELGDPCTESMSECRGGACVEGYCSEPCGTACPEGFVCAEDRDIRTCVADAGVFGDSCDVGIDCASGTCLVVGGDPGTCTRLCDLDQQNCPPGATCERVDGRPVCITAAHASGCTAAHPAGEESMPSLALCLLAFLFAQRRVHAKR